LKLFHHRQFSDLALLCEKKQQGKHHISVVIPTLNEESTIGSIVATIHASLMATYPLVDEIVVMDSGSSDATVERARHAGAKVFSASAVAPQYGDHPGKGENLWKSLFVTTGDITVFIDGDIQQFHEGFVAGLIGPLLDDAGIQFVKAFYQRPLDQGASRQPHGGGRVSEILIRPLFSLFYPELCAFLQPLSGEYAVRRKLLDQLSFPCGYGIETAHLIDVYRLHGMAAFTQCDLDCRVHRNRSVHELGEMAFSLLGTFLERAQRDGMLVIPAERRTEYISHVLSEQGWRLQKKVLDQVERPAYISLARLPTDHES
jgi:glucosyl-3-phosphoglycerate synthase